MRLTKSVVQQLLAQNEGFTFRTSYKGKNLSEDRLYLIRDGLLRISAAGKTSWADSRYSTGEGVADAAQTLRFLRKYLDRLNTDGIN